VEAGGGGGTALHYQELLFVASINENLINISYLPICNS
jgi:hypothetical protein